MDEWINVMDDLPQIQNGLKYCSVNVIAELENGEQKEAFYCDHDLMWYDTCGRKVKKVKRWKSL